MRNIAPPDVIPRSERDRIAEHFRLPMPPQSADFIGRKLPFLAPSAVHILLELIHRVLAEHRREYILDF